MTIIKQAIIAELQRQQDADKLNRLIVQPLCGKDCIIRGPVDLDALAVAISAAPPQPAPDALQRILCGIVGTPDANGMVMFKVHESVVRQMQAAGRPAPVQSGVRGDREAIARAICEADGHDYDRELQFAALNADGVGQQFAQNIINRAHRYADAILSIQSTGDQQTPQVSSAPADGGGVGQTRGSSCR